MPREQLHAPDHDRNRSLGHLAIAWQEHFCLHGPGDVQGRPVVLDDELAEFTVDAYALDARGRRLYDSAFLSRCKGRDKSGHGARLVLFEAFGPCRFAGWAEGGEVFRWRDFTYDYLPGEPMGRPITSPFIRCIATEELQSGHVYGAVFYNLTDGPLAEGLDTDAAGITRTLLPGGGEIRPSTAANASKDGGRETFVVFDETHLYRTPELRRMYATVRRNGTKRRQAEPWTLETSTMYLVGEESVAEKSHELAQAIREGKARTSRFLFDHRFGPPDVDLADAEQLRAALAEALGPFAEHADLERRVSEVFDFRNDPADSRRFLLNVATAADSAWLTREQVEARVETEKKIEADDAIVLGFDGSRRRHHAVTDATALVGCRVSDGHTFVLGLWEEPPGPAGKEWEVPRDEVDERVRRAFEELNVVVLYADPNKWESYIASWEGDYRARLKVKASASHPIEWWPAERRIVRAVEQLHEAIIAGELTLDDSPPHGPGLVRHLLNARRRPTRWGVTITKEHPTSERKIDAAMAAVLAWQARLDALARLEPERKRTGRAVFL